MYSRDAGALLVVEDSDEDYALTVWALQRAGFCGPIRRATHVEQTLGLLCPPDLHRSPDSDGLGEVQPLALMLLDLNLPDGTGRDLMEALRAEHGGALPLPVVVVTTSNNPRDVDMFYRLGAAGYLVKPLDRDRFAEQIRVFVDYWFNILTLPSPAGCRLDSDQG